MVNSRTDCAHTTASASVLAHHITFVLLLLLVFYIVPFSAFEQTHSTLVTCNFERVSLSVSYILLTISTEVVYSQCCLVVTWLVPHETAAISAHVLCTSYKQPCTSLQCHFIWSHICSMHTAYESCVFSCNLPPAPLSEWPESSTCY